MNCVDENKDAKTHFFFKFSFGHSCITHMDIFLQSFLRNYFIEDYVVILCNLRVIN